MPAERRVLMLPRAGLQFRVDDLGRIEQFGKNKEDLVQLGAHRRFVVIGLLESKRGAGQGYRPPRLLGASAGPYGAASCRLKAASNRKAGSDGEGSPMLGKRLEVLQRSRQRCRRGRTRSARALTVHLSYTGGAPSGGRGRV